MHMLLKYHQSDCHQIPDEDKFLALLRPANLKRGFYFRPCTLPMDMKSPAAIDRSKRGPVRLHDDHAQRPASHAKVPGAMVRFLSADRSLRRLSHRTHASTRSKLSTWYSALPGPPALAFGLAHVSDVWKGQPWSMTIKEVIDGLVYGLLTAGTSAGSASALEVLDILRKLWRSRMLRCVPRQVEKVAERESHGLQLSHLGY